MQGCDLLGQGLLGGQLPMQSGELVGHYVQQHVVCLDWLHHTRVCRGLHRRWYVRRWESDRRGLLDRQQLHQQLL